MDTQNCPTLRRSPGNARLAALLVVIASAAGFAMNAAAVGPAVGAAPPPAAASAPFDLEDPVRIEAGRKRFNRTCAGYCHGAEGIGGRAPDFKGRTDLPPEVAFQTISDGRVGADVMPPWGEAFSKVQIWELVAYLQYLGRQPAE